MGGEPLGKTIYLPMDRDAYLVLMGRHTIRLDSGRLINFDLPVGGDICERLQDSTRPLYFDA